MFRRFMVSFSRFMYGRNGIDRMFSGLCIVYFALWLCETLIGILTDWYTAYFVIRLLMLGLFGYMIFRFLSRNVDARRRENERYCNFVDRIFRKNRYSCGGYGQGGGFGGYGSNGGYGNYGQGSGNFGGKKVYSTPEKPTRDRKNYKYVKCKSCGATLRLKRRKGTHTATCPRCKENVRVRSFF